MDSLFHFVFPLIAILAARIKVKYKIRTCLFLAAATAMLDIDHVIGVSRGTLHNVFITVLFPVAMLILSFKLEKKGETYFKNVSLIMLLFLISHPIADMFTEGGVMFFYPFSHQFYDLTRFSIKSPWGYIVSTAGIGLTIYFLLIMSCIFMEDFMSVLKRRRYKDGIAVVKTIEKETKKIEKEL